MLLCLAFYEIYCCFFLLITIEGKKLKFGILHCSKRIPIKVICLPLKIKRKILKLNNLSISTFQKHIQEISFWFFFCCKHRSYLVPSRYYLLEIACNIYEPNVCVAVQFLFNGMNVVGTRIWSISSESFMLLKLFFLFCCFVSTVCSFFNDLPFFLSVSEYCRMNKWNHILYMCVYVLCYI